MMAAIGDGWEDGAWIVASWTVGAWLAAVVAAVKRGARAPLRGIGGIVGITF